MLSNKKQINKMGVKKQTNKTVDKTPVKKKTVNNQLVWECLLCSHRTVSNERPTTCPCSNPNYVVNKQYEVKE